MCIRDSVERGAREYRRFSESNERGRRGNDDDVGLFGECQLSSMKKRGKCVE